MPLHNPKNESVIEIKSKRKKQSRTYGISKTISTLQKTQMSPGMADTHAASKQHLICKNTAPVAILALSYHVAIVCTMQICTPRPSEQKRYKHCKVVVFQHLLRLVSGFAVKPSVNYAYCFLAPEN